MLKEDNEKKEKFNLLKLGKLILILSYVIGGGYVVYAFINFLICKGNGEVFDITGSSYYDSVSIPILVILILSLLIVSVFFIKNNKGAKRILMCIAGGLTLLAGLSLALVYLLWIIMKKSMVMNIEILLRLVGRFCAASLPILVIICTIILIFSKKKLSYNGKFYIAFFVNILILPLLVTLMSHPIMAICFGVFAAIVVIIIVKIGLDTRCPNCKKWFAFHRKESEVIERKETTVKIKQEVKSVRTGEVAYVTDAYVPGMQTTYKVRYQCSNCEYVDYVTQVEKKAIG